jgi:hypothetical protein
MENIKLLKKRLNAKTSEELFDITEQPQYQQSLKNRNKPEEK